MTLKIVTASRLHDAAAVHPVADGRSESIDESRTVPTVEKSAALPAVDGQAARARKAEAPVETDAEPESAVCAAYWAY